MKETFNGCSTKKGIVVVLVTFTSLAAFFTLLPFQSHGHGSSTHFSIFTRSEKKLIWVTSIHEHHPDGICYLKMALKSAVQKCTSLFPVVLHAGQVSNQIDLKHYGKFATFINFESNYTAVLKARYQVESIGSVFARLESASVLLHSIKSGALRGKNLITSHFLYTDVDIMFMRDFPVQPLSTPSSVAFSSQILQIPTPENTGVMIINTSWLHQEVSHIMSYGLATNFKHVAMDQGLLIDYLHYIGIKPEYLDLVYNWKAYWGDNRTTPFIVHWHGPKPLDNCSECIYMNYKSGQISRKWPENPIKMTPVRGSFMIGDFNASQCDHSEICPRIYLDVLRARHSDIGDWIRRFEEYTSTSNNVCLNESYQSLA